MSHGSPAATRLAASTPPSDSTVIASSGEVARYAVTRSVSSRRVAIEETIRMGVSTDRDHIEQPRRPAFSCVAGLDAGARAGAGRCTTRRGVLFAARWLPQ